MRKLSELSRIKELYSKNGNIISYLKELEQKEQNNTEDIMISYDFQAGTYTKGHKNNPNVKEKYCGYLADVINALTTDKSTIMEIGVGEATTLGVLLPKLNFEIDTIYGFDLSWSRIKYAKRFMLEQNISNTMLFTADMFQIPMKDNSIDIVYTSHSIEPNGGKEKEALEELYRITRKYLVLLEPSYEFACDTARERMRKNGYVTKISETINELGYKVIEHRLFDYSVNPLNPTGITVIEKIMTEGIKINNPLCCPITKTELIYEKDAYYSKESMLVYPIIRDIPCLVPQNAIIATKFLD